MIFKTITDDLGNTKLSLNQTVKDLFNGNLFKEQSILSENDINCLKAYNAEIERGVTPMTAYYHTMQNASDSAVNMAQAAGNATVNLEQVAKSSTVAELGLKALSIAGNMLLMWGVTKVITLFHDLATTSDRLKESAEKLGTSLSSTRSDFEDYQKRINELQDIIKSDSSSYQETNDARHQLLGIQDELIEKYGDEAETIRLVTKAINGNNDALNELSQNKAKEILKDFNEGTGKKWTERFADSMVNFFSGSKNNVDRMVNAMEDTKISFRIEPVYGQNLSMIYTDFQKKAKEIFDVQVDSTEIGDTFTVSGDLDEIYNKLQNIKSLAEDMGIENSSFFTDLNKQIDKAKDSLDSYGEAYNQYILSTKIFENDDYTNAFNKIREEYKKYQEAFASGNEESIEKAKQSFAKVVHGATEGIADESVVDFFEQMYPDLQTVVKGWEFELHFKAAIEDNEDNFENDVKDYVSNFKTSDDIRNFNAKTATDEQIQAYNALRQLVSDYETDLDSLITKLEQLGLIAPQLDADIRNSIRSISDDHGISDRNQYAELIEYTSDFTDEAKKLWLESTQGAKNATEAIEMYETALAKSQQTANETPVSPLTISQTIDQLNTQLKPAFDSLKAAYQDIYNDDGVFDLKSIDILSTCDSIKSKLDEMSELGLDVDYSAFENFVRVLNDSESDTYAVDKAFDSLANSITQAALTGAEDFRTMKASLEDLGVVNSDIIAFQSLINNTTALEEAVSQSGLTMADFVVHAEDGSIAATDAATAFIEEMVGAENCQQALALLQLQQVLCNENNLNTTDDINACLSLANAAGVALESLSWLANISAQYDAAVAAGDTVTQKNLSATMASIKSKINAEISNFQPVTADFSGVGKGAKSAGSKAGKDYKGALKEQLSNLDSVISGITGRIDDQISSINEQKSAALDSIDAQKEALEDAKDAAIEALEAQRDAELEVVEAQKKALENQIKLIDKQIKAKQDEIDAINEAAEARKRELDLQKAQYELERMQNQRTILQYSEDKGMHYVQDTSGIRDAKEAVDDAKRQIEIANLENEKKLLEDQKDLLNEQIDLLDERADKINEFYDQAIAKVENYYDQQLRPLEKTREETEAYYDSLSKSLEQRKEKFQELTEILEKAELSAKLKQLGIDEEELLNGSEEEFEKLKNAYMDIVFKLNEGNDEVLNSLRELSGYEGTAPAMLEDSNTKLDEMNQNLTTSNTNVGNVNSSLDKTATTTGTVASNVSDLSSNLDTVNGSITAEQTAFESLKNIIDDVITAINLKIDAINTENTAVATTVESEMTNFQLLINKLLEVKEKLDEINTTVATIDRQPIDSLTNTFQLLYNKILLVSNLLGVGMVGVGEGAVGGITGAIQALNEISLEKGIITQFTNLKRAIDSVTAAISGGSGESSEGEESDTGSGTGGLVGAVKDFKSATDKALIGGGGENAEGEGSEGGGTGVIGLFENLKTAVDDVTTSIGSQESEGADGENSDTLIGSINDLGKSVTDTFGKSGSNGIIGRFEEFRDVIGQADEHVDSIYQGLIDIDDTEVSCTIHVKIETSGSTEFAGSAQVLGSMNLNSATYNAHYEGSAEVTGDWGVKEGGTTLVGELGQELVVFPNGHFRTVGDNGAELIDIPKNSIVFNHLQTRELLSKGNIVGRGRALASGTALANGTNDESWHTLPNGMLVRDLRPGDRGYDLVKAFEPLVKRIQNGQEELFSNAMFEGQKQFEKWTKEITNNTAISNVTNNRNVQPGINIGDINITCPGVTSKEVAQQVGVELNNMFNGLHLEAMQRSMKR